MIYYKYEANEQGVIIAIHSSSVPFEENAITLEQVKKIRVGRTNVTEIANL